MYIVVTISFLAILLTYLDSRGKIRNGMLWGFFLVTLLAVIHYDYGNDYMGYLRLYREISSYTSLSGVINSDLYRDNGWVVINYLFKYIGGFYMLVAAISVFEGVAYYKTIKNYLPRHLWVFGVFIYLISTSFYVLNFSMLRQGFVIALFLMLWPLIENRKWWIVAPILFLSSFVHGSALILIPFAFWGVMPMKNGKVLTVVFAIVLVAMYFSTKLLATIPQFVFSSSETFEYYENTYSESDVTTHFGIGFLVYLIPTIISILYLGKSNVSEESKRLIALSCLVAFFTPLSTVIPLAGRVGMYFGVYRIVALPLAYSSIKQKNLRTGLIVLYSAILIFDYFKFFHSGVFEEHYSSFHTIFGTIL